MADDTQDTVQANENTVAEAKAAEPAKEAAETFEKESPKEEKSLNDSSSKKEAKKTSKNLESIIESIEKLSVLELADLVHALEEKFGVSAAPSAGSVQAAPSGGSGQAAGEPAEEQTTFNVVLANAGANKIAVIKAVREIVPTLGLKEAKDLVESAPKPVLEGVNKATAEEAKAKLTAAGGSVELK